MNRLTIEEVAEIRGYASLAKVQKRRRVDIMPVQLEQLADQTLKRERDVADLVEALKSFSNLYTHAWDLKDGGLYMNKWSVELFEKVHEHSSELLARIHTRDEPRKAAE